MKFKELLKEGKIEEYICYISRDNKKKLFYWDEERFGQYLKENVTMYKDEDSAKDAYKDIKKIRIIVKD